MRSSNGYPSADPALSAFEIKPHDKNNLRKPAVGIYVGGAGSIKVDMYDGTTVTFAAVPIGTYLPVCAKKVYESGTTATLLIGLQ